MDDFLAIGATLQPEEREDDGDAVQRVPGDLIALVHATGGAYPFLGCVDAAEAETGEEEDGSPLDPLILDGLIHV